MLREIFGSAQPLMQFEPGILLYMEQAGFGLNLLLSVEEGMDIEKIMQHKESRVSKPCIS
ncbi:hypothetical protein [Planomicrobium sp. CPCC 101110]|uniref:hypothetical protein n=1 Tax=Planomicrobium sp. CPCC 101110 TaxID=2599619 RepID=UPI0011B6E090|nr:hypothetical protein [Planomicrobium sp. CPCC 101110]TWT25219.1 hypothetical protein FQV30_12685 [Planomicrobium sp. CPCC 101110]